MDTFEVEVFYVAWVKHGRPQHVVAGPYGDVEEAHGALMESFDPHNAVMSTTVNLKFLP